MPFPLEFTKVTGAGNDFVLIDALRRPLPLDPAPLARLLCSRYHGVGADGILLILPSSIADFTMGYWNADGSTGGMCGNGGRCAANYASERGIAGKQMTFEAFGHVYGAQVTPLGIRLRMKPASGMRNGIRLDHAGREFLLDYVNTGSPHTVTFVHDLETLDVTGFGRWLRHHPEFSPLGTNANFVQAVDHDTILVRTYERGVEAETMACGTGSVASAMMHRRKHPGKEPVTVVARSGARLRVHLHGSGTDGETSPELEGEAYNVFDGKGLISDDYSGMTAVISGTTGRTG